MESFRAIKISLSICLVFITSINTAPADNVFNLYHVVFTKPTYEMADVRQDYELETPIKSTLITTGLPNTNPLSEKILNYAFFINKCFIFLKILIPPIQFKSNRRIFVMETFVTLFSKFHFVLCNPVSLKNSNIY